MSILASCFDGARKVSGIRTTWRGIRHLGGCATLGGFWFVVALPAFADDIQVYQGRTITPYQAQTVTPYQARPAQPTQGRAVSPGRGQPAQASGVHLFTPQERAEMAANDRKAGRTADGIKGGRWRGPWCRIPLRTQLRVQLQHGAERTDHLQSQHQLQPLRPLTSVRRSAPLR